MKRLPKNVYNVIGLAEFEANKKYKKEALGVRMNIGYFLEELPKVDMDTGEYARTEDGELIMEEHSICGVGEVKVRDPEQIEAIKKRYAKLKSEGRTMTLKVTNVVAEPAIDKVTGAELPPRNGERNYNLVQKDYTKEIGIDEWKPCKVGTKLTLRDD